MIAVQEEDVVADDLDVHVRIAGIGVGRRQRVVDLDVGRRIERSAELMRLLRPRAVRPVGVVDHLAGLHRHLRQPVGLVPDERAVAVIGGVAVGVVGEGSAAQRQRRVRARRLRARIGEGAGKPRAGEQVAGGGIGVGFRESGIADIGCRQQPVEIVVGIGPVLRRADAGDRGDSAGRVARIGVVDDLRAVRPGCDDARQPAPRRRIGEGGVDAVRIIDALRLAVGFILDLSCYAALSYSFSSNGLWRFILCVVLFPWGQKRLEG